MEQKPTLPTAEVGDIFAVGLVQNQQHPGVSVAAAEEEHDTPSISALSLSDSSHNESPAEFATLLGESIDSKDAKNNIDDVFEFSGSEDPPSSSLIPVLHPTPHDYLSDPIWECSYGNVKKAPHLSPQIQNDVDTVAYTSSNSTGPENFVGRVIGPNDLEHMVDYPCHHQSEVSGYDCALSEPHLFPLKNFCFEEDSEGVFLLVESDDEGDYQLEEEMNTGELEDGVRYRISRVLVEGSLHKKGTGGDWIGSRGWKLRWARLALGHIEGHGEVAIPLLCIAWYPSSVDSTVIVLDSTVVVSVDSPNKSNPYRFEIRQTGSQKNSILPAVRTFSAPSSKARDAWLDSISEALASYEKDKAQASSLVSGFGHLQTE